MGELSTFKHSVGALLCTTSSRERLKTPQPGTAPPNTHLIFLEVKPRYKVQKCPHPPWDQPTCVRAKVAFESCVTGKGAVALTADIAAHARVDLHVLLERALCLEALPTQETENSHVRACGRQQRERVSEVETQGQNFTPEGWSRRQQWG